MVALLKGLPDPTKTKSKSDWVSRLEYCRMSKHHVKNIVYIYMIYLLHFLSEEKQQDVPPIPFDGSTEVSHQNLFS